MKKILIIIIIIFIMIITTVLAWPKSTTKSENVKKQEVSQSDSAQIVSTKPNPLEDTIVGANDTIEITFNKPLQNTGEFKVKIEPKVDFKLALSSDRKTGKIIPNKPYELGASYTLFIGTDTKFDGVGAWGQEKIYHFKTIHYRGV